MKLFVTGGTGFVGSHVLQQAVAAGHEVIALRRPGSQTRIPLDIEPTWLDGALDGDHREALRGVDVWVHLASHTPNPPYAPLDACLYWNVYAPIKLAQQALQAGVGRFIVAGSCFEYGRAAEGLDEIRTDTPLAPTLSYPSSKAAASQAFAGFAREHGVQLKLLRIFQVYGEGEQASRLWPSLRLAARSGADFPMSAGEQVRDFVDVVDVARQFIRHLDFDAHPSPKGEPSIHHIASGHPQTLLAFAQHWWAHWGATGKILPGAMPYRKHEIMRLVPHLDPDTLHDHA
ncbi:NAD-dependent epimerase/dehydratase family protein [Leptothrix ochracea]|uniref:NAD-dependent epimerase/dehydratase family protein n=1 Tax=Leptothrix ochracea TaxID=735331 RepID=UPI0034E1C13D